MVVGPITNSAVAVTNGLFTTRLDFGAGVFDGSDRWLEIGVATNGSGVFTNLSPRQLVTSAPYAIQAANAANAAVAASASSVSALNITGTLTTAQLPTSVVTNGASGVSISGTFSGNGSGLTNVPGTMPWQSADGTSVTAAANQAYLLTNPALDTLTLPVDATVGDVVTVSGTGSNGWQVAAGSGQSIAGSSPDIHYWTANNNAPSTNWSGVASSADGTKLVALGSDGIWTSTNSGVSWSDNNNAPSSNIWYSVASSADGTKLVALANGGGIYAGIYTSTNSGVSWVYNHNVPSTNNWWSVASSADGTRLVAVVIGGGIWTSTDSGVTWSANNNAPPAAWASVASSADGARFVAVVSGGQIWTSGAAYSGAPGTTVQFQYLGNGVWQPVGEPASQIVGTFSGDGSGLTNVPGTMPWQSAGGTNITAAANQAYLLTNAALDTVTLPTSATVGDVVTVSGTGSNHWQVVPGLGESIAGYSGVTWSDNNNAPLKNWQSVASSADGTKLVAVIDGGGIYTSTNSGTSWSDNNNAAPAAWASVASSADGTQLVAVGSTGIYTSTNSGVTWSDINNAPSTGWQSVASSADGTRLVAVVNGGGIYTSTNSGVTWSDNNNAPSALWQSVASSSDGTRLVAVVAPGRIWTFNGSEAPGTTVQYQYLGNGVWQTVGQPASQIVGTLSPSQLPSNLVINGETGVTLGGTFSGTFSGIGSGLTALNAVGYGTRLPLNLVYNPLGPNLPPPQAELEADYKSELRRRYGVEFTGLFTITNQPIARFAEDLRSHGRWDAYLELLANSFNPATVENLMCRTTLSVGWLGEIYDCDFNQMLNLQLRNPDTSGLYLWDVTPEYLENRPIQTGVHCLACTAGCGSSCGGVLQRNDEVAMWNSTKL